MQTISQIKVGKHMTGIVGLKDTLREMAELETAGPDKKMDARKIGSEMIRRLSGKNYIPSGAYDLYEAAFAREYKKFKGEPVPDEPLEEVEIKVLGAGCPNCDRLEAVLMELIQEMGIQADLEHVRDMQKIAAYGVMGSPALVINRKVKAVGSVPSRSKLKAFIMAAAAELHNQSGER